MQQINLYQPILRKQERVFSLNTLLKGNAVIFGLLMLIYFIGVYQSSSLEDQLEELKKERTKHSETLTELRNKYPPKKKDLTLAELIKAKQSLLEHRQRLIDELEHQNTGAGGNPGFSEQLIALSRQHKKELWLEMISVRDNKQLTLSGKAVTAKEVPLLIQRLSTEPSFAGTIFSAVRISRSDNNALIVFSLGTDLEGNKDERKGAMR